MWPLIDEDIRQVYPPSDVNMDGYIQLMKEKNMEMPVGVLCLRESQRYWSEADSIVPEDAYSTSRQVLDIAGKIKVQAWADYDTALLFRHLDPVVYVLLLLMTGMLMWIWPSRKKSVDKMEETAEEIPQGTFQ